MVLTANGSTAFTFQQQATCPNAQSSSWNVTTKNATTAANWPALAGAGVTFKFDANNTAPPNGWLNVVGNALQSLLGDAETVAEFAGQVIEVIGPALAAAARWYRILAVSAGVGPCTALCRALQYGATFAYGAIFAPYYTTSALLPGAD